MRIYSIPSSRIAQTDRQKTQKLNFGKIPEQAAKSFSIEAFIVLVSLRNFSRTSSDSKMAADLMKHMLGEQFWSDIQRLSPKPFDEVFKPIIIPKCIEACRKNIFDLFPEIKNAELNINPETIPLQVTQSLHTLDVSHIKDFLLKKGLPEKLKIAPFSQDEVKSLTASIIRALREAD